MPSNHLNPLRIAAQIVFALNRIDELNAADPTYVFYDRAKPSIPAEELRNRRDAAISEIREKLVELVDLAAGAEGIAPGYFDSLDRLGRCDISTHLAAIRGLADAIRRSPMNVPLDLPAISAENRHVKPRPVTSGNSPAVSLADLGPVFEPDNRFLPESRDVAEKLTPRRLPKDYHFKTTGKPIEKAPPMSYDRPSAKDQHWIRAESVLSKTAVTAEDVRHVAAAFRAEIDRINKLTLALALNHEMHDGLLRAGRRLDFDRWFANAEQDQAEVWRRIEQTGKVLLRQGSQSERSHLSRFLGNHGPLSLSELMRNLAGFIAGRLFELQETPAPKVDAISTLCQEESPPVDEHPKGNLPERMRQHLANLLASEEFAADVASVRAAKDGNDSLTVKRIRRKYKDGQLAKRFSTEDGVKYEPYHVSKRATIARNEIRRRIGLDEDPDSFEVCQ